jgi:hypothetical protein
MINVYGIIWALPVLIERVSYKLIVGNDFDVNARERGTGLEFRPSEGLMELGEPNQIIHG